MDPILTKDQLLDLLHEHKIVPDILKALQVQNLKAPLQILYPNDLTVGQGEEVARDKVGDIPTILFTEAVSIFNSFLSEGKRETCRLF